MASAAMLDAFSAANLAAFVYRSLHDNVAHALLTCILPSSLPCTLAEKIILRSNAIGVLGAIFQYFRFGNKLKQFHLLKRRKLLDEEYEIKGLQLMPNEIEDTRSGCNAILSEKLADLLENASKCELNLEYFFSWEIPQKAKTSRT